MSITWRDHLVDARRWAGALRARLDPNGRRTSPCSWRTPGVRHGAVRGGARRTRGGRAQHDANAGEHSPATWLSRLRTRARRARHHRVARRRDTAGVPVVDVTSSAWLREVDIRTDEAPAHRPAPDDLFMLIFTSGTKRRPEGRPVRSRQGHRGRTMLADRFRTRRPRWCLSVDADVPLQRDHRRVGRRGRRGCVDRTAAAVLRVELPRRRPPVRCDLRELRGQAVELRPRDAGPYDDADNPLRIVYGNEASARGHLPRFADRFGVRVVDGFGSTEGGVAIGRTPDTPPRRSATRPACRGRGHRDRTPCPPASSIPTDGC